MSTLIKQHFWKLSSKPQSTRSGKGHSGVHSIKVETLAQSGEGGGCTPTPFHYIYDDHEQKICGERADTLLLFLLYPYILYSARNSIPGNMQGIGRRIILCMWKRFRNKKMREC